MAAYPGASPPLQGNLYSAEQPQQYGGMQIQGGPLLPSSSSPQRENLPSYIFLVLAAFVLAFSAVNLSLNYWVYYCGTWLSLEDIVSGGYSDSISHTIKDICDYPSYYLSCDHLCGNLKDFRTAGRVMLAFGIISMVLTGLAVMRFMMLLMHYSLCLQGWIVRGAMIGGTFAWVLGTIVYGGMYGKVHNEDKESITGPGLELAIAIAVLQLVMCAIGMVAVKKLPIST